MTEKKKKQKNERCQSCEEFVKIGEYLRVCKQVGSKKECKVLIDKISSEEITAEQLYKEIRKKVKKGSKVEKLLDEVDKIMDEIADENKD